MGLVDVPTGEFPADCIGKPTGYVLFCPWVVCVESTLLVGSYCRSHTAGHAGGRYILFLVFAVLAAGVREECRRRGLMVHSGTDTDLFATRGSG